MEILKFRKYLVEKVWGGKAFKKILNFNISDNINYGESWEVSCHPAGMSKIENGLYKGITFQEIIKKYGKEVLGEEIIEKYGEKFPLLIKYLDINDKLSVQVHPNDEYALRVEKEFGKSEVWYVMEASKDAKLILGLKDNITKEKFKEKIEKKDFSNIFNEIKVKKGDFIDIKPGVVHGTLEGSILICEIQQNSDTTYRIYDFDREIDGKKRELHLDKALDVIEFGKKVKITTNKERTREKILGGEKEILIRDEYYNIDKIFIKEKYDDGKYKNFRIYSIIDGEGRICSEGKKYEIKKGETYFIPANINVEIEGNLEIIKSYI